MKKEREFQVKVHFSEAVDAESKLLNVYEFLLSLDNPVPINNQDRYEEKHIPERAL
jgi:hypothetical protein